MGKIMSLLLVALLVSGYTWGKDEEKKGTGATSWDTAAGTKGGPAPTGMPDARTMAAAAKVAKMGGAMPNPATMAAAAKVAKISPESLKAAANAAKLNAKPGAVAGMAKAVQALKGKDGKPMDPKMLQAAISVAKAMNANKKQVAG